MRPNSRTTKLGRRLRGPAITLARWGLVFVAVLIFLRLARRVDWSQVADAIGRLTLWQVVVLLALVGVRAILNAVPLAMFVPGLGVKRAVANDQPPTSVRSTRPRRRHPIRRTNPTAGQ